MAFLDQTERLRQAHELYERYGRPLEAMHRDEYVAIAPNGSLLLAATLEEAVLRAGQTLSPGNFVFKIGDLVVGSWR